VEVLREEQVEEVIGVVSGMALLFFGGSFALVAGAIEAFKFSGQRGLTRALRELHNAAMIALEELEKDDMRSERDVSKLPTQEYAFRKMKVILRSLDPSTLEDAASSVFSGLAAIIATLRARFAQAITLGANHSHGIRRPIL